MMRILYFIFLLPGFFLSWMMPSENRSGRNNKVSGLDSIPGECYTCHENVKQEIDTLHFVHKALKESRQCSNCHTSHPADGKKTAKANQDELCLSCHNITVKGKDGSGMINMRQHLAENPIRHSALGGGCVSCHKPHASNENYLLISSFPRERYNQPKKENFNLCWECHDSDIFDAEKTTSTNFRNGERNLHRLHLAGDRGRSCVICHDVHAAKKKFLILDKVIYGQWTFDMNFVPDENGGSCYPACHDLKIYKR